jgi:hypothetical protein
VSDDLRSNEWLHDALRRAEALRKCYGRGSTDDTRIVAMANEIERLRAVADGYKGAVERLNRILEQRRKPERPWGWYREITPGTFTVEKGDWPPPEPDDVAWLPLYASPEGRPADETFAVPYCSRCGINHPADMEHPAGSPENGELGRSVTK